MIFQQFLSFILFLFVLESFNVATPPPRTEDPHSNNVLAYWNHLLGEHHTLQELVDYERKCADEVDHFEILSGDELKDRPDYMPVAPMTVFPSAFPRHFFDMAMAVQPAMNLLYFRASRDYEFLTKTFEAAKEDAYIFNLLDILHKLHDEGVHQPIGVMLERADYMLHMDEDLLSGEQQLQLKQIEVNVGNGGGPDNSVRQTKVHRKMLSKLGLKSSLDVLPDNQPYTTYAEAIYNGWLHFGDPNSVLLMVVKKSKPSNGPRPEPSRVDKLYGHRSNMHYFTDFAEEINRLSSGKLDIVYLSLDECHDKTTLDPNDFTLRLQDGRKVGLVFYRWAFGSEKAWDAREKIERSTAVKAPTVAMALMGTKKGQQALAMPGVVEHFFPDPEESHYVDAIRKTFAGLWGFENDDSDTKKVMEDVMEHPERYVLKPMKEGGGHNFFGQNIVDKLNTLTPSQRTAFILMERLNPMTVPNYFLRPGREPQKFDHLIQELGIFGGLVGNESTGNVLHNHGNGYMIRTKRADSDEGGIWVGAGVYDSPYLY